MTKEFIDEAINKAVNGQSGIDPEVLQVKGFSTPTIRGLFHSLCDQDRPINYLEIGLFYGGSFFAALNKNVTATGVEDHSQDFSEGFENVKKELKENFEKFKSGGNEVNIIYADCYTMDKSEIPDNIDVYFFDGFHSHETQAKALPHFFDKMADRFIWVVDDLNWDYVASGTNEALVVLQDKMEVEHCRILRGYHLNNDPVWHNGVGVYLIKKK